MAQYSVWLTIQTDDDQGPATIAASVARAVDSELMMGMNVTSLHVDTDDVEAVSEAHA